MLENSGAGGSTAYGASETAVQTVGEQARVVCLEPRTRAEIGYERYGASPTRVKPVPC